MIRNITRLPRLLQAYLLVAAADIVGAIVAIATGLASASHTLISGTAINAPFPFLAGQLAIAALAVSSRRHQIGTAAATVLIVLGAVSVLSGFGDGSYSNSALTAADRAIQLSIVTATASTIAAAGAQIVRTRRSRRELSTA